MSKTDLHVHLLVLGGNAGQAGAVRLQRGFRYRHVLLHDLPGLPFGDLLCQRCLLRNLGISWRLQLSMKDLRRASWDDSAQCMVTHGNPSVGSQ